MMVGAAPPVQLLVYTSDLQFCIYFFSSQSLFVPCKKYIINEDCITMEYSTAVSMQLQHPSFT